ncbi:hypothetical protein CANINC_004351 [Pichia inconspicua]|uniref:Vacuolar protein sorting-associated protein 51 homolog n=1 Tax=Pichia inconspicua TaxID=52247 RepID=A0A4T0WWY3_9ASCO|nr:hypothetical protein CANINC_004351 [[Candida] inconspicua]
MNTGSRQESGNRGNKVALEAIKAQRDALKNFYKLKEQTQAPQSQVKTHPENASNLYVGDIDPSQIKDLRKFIEEEHYLNILKVENEVLDRLSNSKSEIKSIIYNNYYELIKINTVLEELLKPKDGKIYFDEINNNLEKVRSNMEKLRSTNLDIFGDLK